MSEQLTGLTLALCKQAYQDLLNSDSDVGPGLEKDVASGKSPEEIYRETITTIGDHRIATAIRCRNAARYLIYQRQQAQR